MSKNIFKLKSSYSPAGDQPKAISALVSGLEKGMRKQTLLGATGTGKTFTIANVIEKYNKPTLVIAHNKTLAAQLAQEFREFFPDAAVHYFVSYYDYYQPEAYMPTTDTYIEKDAQINKEIDRLRHATTQSLLTRKDVIIVASVSCIYGLGSPEEYQKVNLQLEVDMKIGRLDLMKKLVSIHFERTNADMTPGTFRSIGQKVEIMPISENFVYQIEFSLGLISRIAKVDPVSSHIIKPARPNNNSGHSGEEEKSLPDGEVGIFIFPAKHFITDKDQLKRALQEIKIELNKQIKKFDKEGKVLEAERIKRRTNYDLAMIKEIGYCNGIENYSRIMSGKKEGEAPDTLLSYFPSDFLTIIDESHVTLPQIAGMYAGDASRKNTLIEFGFRLPSARDNRPLKIHEFEEKIGQVIYVSATPGKREIEESKKSCDQTCSVGNRISKKSVVSCGVVEQIIRPTGLIDPEIIVRPVSANQKVLSKEELSEKNHLSLSARSSLRRAHAYDFLSDNSSFDQYPGQTRLPSKEEDYGGQARLPSKEEDYGGQARLPSKEEDYGGQVQDFIIEADKTIKKGFRVLATTLTKKMAEDLSLYLKDKGLKAEYLHSEIKTIERIQILTSFRKGDIDILVGVNLLREGLDLPEVALIGILDADKAGFLRSETALIQTIGRAARNVFGRVILYADIMNDSLENAISETNRRRSIQTAHNLKYKITPKTILKKIKDITEELEDKHEKAVSAELGLDLEIFKKAFAKDKSNKGRGERDSIKNLLVSDDERNKSIYEKIIKLKEKEINKAIKELDFESAAILRDEIFALNKKIEKK